MADQAQPFSFAGVPLERPLLMGIVNVTPDSFHDGGRHPLPEQAAAHGRRLLEEGAAILDIGGESTRPGAAPVLESVEIERVVPVVRGFAGRGALVSIDTRHPSVMVAAIKAGARIVNDIAGLSDPESRRIVRESGVHAVIMHMQGEPGSMQAEPHYDDCLAEVYDWLAARLALCEAEGIPRARIAIDPGIGFGKSLDHNLALLKGLRKFHELGCPLLLGASRKSFIAHLCGGIPSDDRLPGSLAAALWGASQGVHILRVHDVAATAQALTIWSRLC
ncbi:MAG: dihydropteroate synthase [Rhodospirillales bacterium]|jgi:dihydropteroate synthase|nr:dihydropteroate synthase [Rhodospirillales bacterium]